MTADETAAPGVAAPAAALPEDATPGSAPVDQVDALIAEVDNEAEAAGAAVEPADILDPDEDVDVMPVGGSEMFLRREATPETPASEVKLYVLPVGDWPTSAMTDLRSINYDGWASKVLTDISQDTWYDFGPRIGEVDAMMSDWRQRRALDAGKSRPSTRSSRSTRRQ